MYLAMIKSPFADHGETDSAGDELLAADHHWLRGGPGPHHHRHLPGGQAQEGQAHGGDGAGAFRCE